MGLSPMLCFILSVYFAILFFISTSFLVGRSSCEFGKLGPLSYVSKSKSVLCFDWSILLRRTGVDDLGAFLLIDLTVLRESFDMMEW